MKRTLSLALSLVCILCLASLAGATDEKVEGFTKHYAESLFVVSEKGAFGVEVLFKAEPRVGKNEADIIVHDKDDKDVTGAEVSVEPWMPMHGHGSGSIPTVNERGGGAYSSDNVAFIMPGEWELRVTVKAGGVEDRAVFTLTAVAAPPPEMEEKEVSAAVMISDRTKATKDGLFRVSYEPLPDPPPVKRVHVWMLRVHDTDGKAVEGAEIAVSGEMPEHGHGMPSEPTVSERGGGSYTASGLNFSMPGFWKVTVRVKAGGKEDEVVFSLLAGAAAALGPHAWTESELRTMRSLALSALPPLPPSASNAYADDPKAAALGKKIFFDPRFSANGKVSCSTCHRPDMSFTDNLPVAHGMAETSRRSMPILNAAYFTWFFWDGRKDSLWSQAIGPIESPVEHGITRTTCVHLVAENYREDYEAVFGKLDVPSGERCPAGAMPSADNAAARALWEGMRAEDRETVNRIYSNIGKAVAAYERTILSGPAPFDRYVEALVAGDRDGMEQALSPLAAQGLRLFIGRAKCASCHNGPLFMDDGFDSIATPPRRGHAPDEGRAGGIPAVLGDEFNCLGPYSDAKPEECETVNTMDRDASRYVGAFKTPTLRNVAERPPYMHAGQMRTLREVMVHYMRMADRIPEMMGVRLSMRDLAALEAFLRALTGPVESL
jgi:cytochrome c peroxidase